MSLHPLFIVYNASEVRMFTSEATEAAKQKQTSSLPPLVRKGTQTRQNRYYSAVLESRAEGADQTALTESVRVALVLPMHFGLCLPRAGSVQLLCHMTR